MVDIIHPAAQKGFHVAAALYQQVRPNYPQEIVQWLQQDLGLDATSQLLDLGAGTGKFLDSLSQVSSHVFAVEPVAAMLEQLKLKHPHVQAHQATTEQLPLPTMSMDAVLCAQSFHWFANQDSLKAIHQVLKVQASLGLVWNQRDETVSWVKALADLLAGYEADTPRFHSHQWKQVLQDQHLFQFIDLKTFAHSQRGRVEDVVSKRLLSTSFVAAMSTEQQQQLKQQFEDIVFQHTGLSADDQIEFPYLTYAYHYRKI